LSCAATPALFVCPKFDVNLSLSFCLWGLITSPPRQYLKPKRAACVCFKDAFCALSLTSDKENSDAFFLQMSVLVLIAQASVNCQPRSSLRGNKSREKLYFFPARLFFHYLICF
jgi:hypothetical protein